MNFSRLVMWITLLAVFAMAARISVDTDTWWHLRAGKWIVENGAIPQTDPFSYTRLGEPWQYPGWLVEVPMYAIFNWFGPGGLNLLTAVMVMLTFAFLWKSLSGGPLLRAFVIVLAAATSAVYWAARPYLVTFLLTSVFLWILEDWRWDKSREDGRRLWLLPLLMIIWANSHGGFAVGFLLWGVYFAREGGRCIWSIMCQRWFSNRRAVYLDCHEGDFPIYKRRFVRISIVGLLMVIAVCINPYGLVMLAYPFKTIGIGVLQDYIQEWQSPDFHSLSVQPFALLLILTFATVGASRKRIAFTDFVLIAGFAYMGLMARRNIAIFSLVAPVVLTRYAAPFIVSVERIFGKRQIILDTPPSRKQVIINWGILIVIILAVLLKVSQIYPRSVNEGYFGETLPVDAAGYLKENQPSGRLFNSYNWGGYVLWALPEYPVFVDGRTDLYDDEIFNVWLKVVQGEDGWQEILNKWDVNIILLEPDSPVIEKLEGGGWKLTFMDQLAVIYMKSNY